MKVTVDDVAQALVALGRSEAFAWLAEELGDGVLLAEARECLEALADDDFQIAKGVANQLKEESEDAR